MESDELKNAGGSESMIESNFWKRNSNHDRSSLKSQTLPRPRRKLPTDCGSGSTRKVSIWRLN